MFFVQRSQANVEESGRLQELIIVSASEFQRLLEELLSRINLAMLDGQNAMSPNDITAGYFRGYSTHLRCLSEVFLSFRELVQASARNALDCKNLDPDIFVVGSSRRRIKQRQNLRIHSAP